MTGSTQITKKDELSELKLSQAAKKNVQELISGKTNYTELWYGTPKARDEALSTLKDFFKNQNLKITETKKIDPNDKREYYVIQIKKTGEIEKKIINVEKEMKTIPKRVEPVKDKEQNVKTYVEPEKIETGNLTKHQTLEKYFGPKIADSIIKHSAKYNVDPYVIASLIVAEHSGRNDKNALEIVGNRLKNNPNKYSGTKSPQAISKEQSEDLAQFVPSTLKLLLEKGDTIESVGKDYDKSIKYMAKFIAAIQKANKLTTPEEIAFAYNAGPTTLNNLKKEGGDWQENLERKLRPNLKGTYYYGHDYIKKILKTYNQLNSS